MTYVWDPPDKGSKLTLGGKTYSKGDTVEIDNPKDVELANRNWSPPALRLETVGGISRAGVGAGVPEGNHPVEPNPQPAGEPQPSSVPGAPRGAPEKPPGIERHPTVRRGAGDDDDDGAGAKPRRR